MERHTRGTLLQWLEEKPRSLGWNAIVAYDRSYANAAMIQDYITRFEAASYLRPITARIAMSEDEAEYIYGFTLDRPRLSFENAKVQWSLARLLVRVTGGTQLTTRKLPGGMDQVVKVSSYDAVNGPDITMGLSLAVQLGSVDSQGRVTLDLSKGTEIDVNFADSRDHRRIGGEFFRTLFEGLPDEQKVFVLGEIGSAEGQMLKPRNVQIRTHASPGAGVSGAPDYGLGAVLMFITMEGEEYGTFPADDADFQYLIPFEENAGFTATIMLDNEFVMRRFIEEGCRRMTETPDQFRYETSADAEGFVSRLRVTVGNRTGSVLDCSSPSFPSIHCAGLKTPLGAAGDCEATFEVGFEGDALSMEWRGFKDQFIELLTAQNNRPAENVRCAWALRRSFRVGVDSESGQLRWLPAPVLDPLHCKVSPLAFASIPEVANHFEEISDCLEAELARHLDAVIQDFVEPLADLDVFRLNSMLFRDRFVFEPVEGHLPGDLIIFGRIAPDATAFTVSPVEPLVGPGETLQFTLTPALSGVTWRVERIVGGNGNPGVIDAASGRYTAPADSQIQGFFNRVRVTATRGDYSSSALVTVVVRDVTFNPLVVVCGAGLKTEMSAAARDGSPLQWSLGGQVSGSQIVPSTEPGGDHTYIAPPVSGQQAVEAFSLDQVHVQRPGRAGLYTSYVLVVNRPPTATISIKPDADLPEGSVRLIADLGKGPVETGCRWEMLAGSGQVDADTGVYTVDPAGQHRFALVTVTVSASQPIFPPYPGYLILALPLSLALAQHYSAGASS